ncbi:MAG TPA: ATP-grasp domain-containing protein [Leptospiraceae bacterium]|nr:ATP-grasp domain-containing protein [Leptospiraceae bacterium]HMY69337.1 ATP-grasp domain-containing protein [Leptospiraceae bacterium]HNF15863.1 ATP-grasp domain-containing protein [Leptospiraceae bacterium]HNI96543.1 ATP-grasp domain-containing protein [Leptospiraceae bacterium]HNM01721.1 ATP-grasp domain-containing protein [Leptospiraceae bacterium]
MKTLNIAVTGINPVDSPGPGIPVIRSFRESKLNIRPIGLSYDVLEPGNFMKDLLSCAYIIPYPSAGAGALLERILYIHSQEKLDMIFPTLDSELDNFIEIQSALEAKGIRTFLPEKKQLHLRDKSLLSELQDEDVNIPKTLVVNSVSTIYEAGDKIRFPVFVKGLFYEAFYARGIEEAAGYFYKVAAKWGLPIILQEAIQGEECNLAGASKDGRLFGAVTMKKMFLTDKGKAWAGVTIKNDKVLQISKKIISKIGWNSGFELEYIVEKGSGKIYLLEMNPRLPAWIYLATASGVNLPELIVKAAMGESVGESIDYEPGKIFVRHSWDEIVPMKYIESLSVKGENKFDEGKTE